LNDQALKSGFNKFYFQNARTSISQQQQNEPKTALGRLPGALSQTRMTEDVLVVF